MKEQWIDIRAACAILKCHPCTVAKYAKLGKIRKYQVLPGGGGVGKRGSTPYYHAGDVEGLLPPKNSLN